MLSAHRDRVEFLEKGLSHVLFKARQKNVVPQVKRVFSFCLSVLGVSHHLYGKKNHTTNGNKRPVQIIHQQPDAEQAEENDEEEISACEKPGDDASTTSASAPALEAASPVAAPAARANPPEFKPVGEHVQVTLGAGMDKLLITMDKGNMHFASVPPAEEMEYFEKELLFLTCRARLWGLVEDLECSFQLCCDLFDPNPGVENNVPQLLATQISGTSSPSSGSTPPQTSSRPLVKFAQVALSGGLAAVGAGGASPLAGVGMTETPATHVHETGSDEGDEVVSRDGEEDAKEGSSTPQFVSSAAGQMDFSQHFIHPSAGMLPSTAPLFHPAGFAGLTSPTIPNVPVMLFPPHAMNPQFRYMHPAYGFNPRMPAGMSQSMAAFHQQHHQLGEQDQFHRQMAMQSQLMGYPSHIPIPPPLSSGNQSSDPPKKRKGRIAAEVSLQDLGRLDALSNTQMMRLCKMIDLPSYGGRSDLHARLQSFVERYKESQGDVKTFDLDTCKSVADSCRKKKRRRISTISDGGLAVSEAAINDDMDQDAMGADSVAESGSSQSENDEEM